MAFLKASAAIRLSMVLTALCPILASAGPGGRGGGGPQAADFQTAARTIEASLKRSPEEADTFFGIQGLTSSYSAAVASTDVVCATDAILASMRKNIQKAFYDGEDTIYLDCANYVELDRAGGGKYVVVFHEYMRKIGVETSDYRVSSRLPLYVFPTTGKRAIDAFCAGGARDKYQLETYIAQMMQEKTIDDSTAKMLREAAGKGIQFPDANARMIATYLGWNKYNQYQWVVELTCYDKDKVYEKIERNDTTRNRDSVITLDGGSNAVLALDKSITIRHGRAAVMIQNGVVPAKADQYQSSCEFAHDTDTKRDTKIGSRIFKSGNISAVVINPSQGSVGGFQVNFSIPDDKSLTDIQVWMPGDVFTVERLRSVLHSCGVTLDLSNASLPIKPPSVPISQ